MRYYTVFTYNDFIEDWICVVNRKTTITVVRAFTKWLKLKNYRYRVFCGKNVGKLIEEG